MPDSLRVALVTGAGSGIGAAIALRLAREGIAVICSDLDGESANRVSAVVSAAGGRAVGLQLDVSDDALVGALPETIGRTFGQLDILVNNAGISADTDVREPDMAAIRRILAVNLEGAIAVTLAVRPLLAASPSGRIVNVSSIQGFRAGKRTLAYGASKAGLLNITRSLAVDLADDGILVNALAPGFIDTPMARYADGSTEYDTDWFRSIYVENARIPLRRPGLPDEVAAAAAYFCSEANSYVTGQVLAVDGGLTATF